MSKILTITNAGLAEIVNHETLGLGPVVINRVVLSSAKLTGDLRTRTSVPDVVKTLTGDDVRGGIAGDNVLNVVAQDTSDSAYTVFTYGVYSATNVLIGIYSQNDPILTKTSVSVGLFAMDLALVNISPASITVGNIEFINPPATTTRAGVAQLATAAETQAGSNNTKIVTPSALASVTATTDRRGLIEVATNVETQAGTDSARAVTPAALNSRIATDTRTGLVELATSLENIAGTDVGRAVTPFTMFAALNSFGVGGLSPEPPGNSLNHIDNSVRPGCYGINTATIGSPSNTEAGVCYWSRRAIDRETQFVVFENSDGGMYYRSRNQTNSGNWSGWRKIAADVVYATAAQAGLVELATNTESATGTDTTRAVTPAGVKAAITANAPIAATESSAGVVELATVSEATAGTDTTRAVTPAGVKAAITANAPIAATESSAGVVELATVSEATAGTDTTRAVTPTGLKAAIVANAPASATEAGAGVVELATALETQVGTDNTRAVTPAALNSRIATDTRTGLVELATSLENIAGTDVARAVTPFTMFAALNSFGVGGLSPEPPGNSLNHIDNSVRPGCYGINTATIGSPSNTEAGVCYWSRRAIDRETQFVVFENSDGGMYYRSRNQTNSGNWSGWRKIAADVVYATAAQAGLVELATNTESATGTDTTRAVTPAGVKAAITANAPIAATESSAGVVELATASEVTAGTDTTRAVTPAGVKAAITANAPIAATESSAGVVELATVSEATAGTDGTRAVTPTGLKAAIVANAPASATEAGAGVVELATALETQVGTDNTRAVTPAALNSRIATDTRTGLVELATSLENIAGTDVARAVTPFTMFAALNSFGVGGLSPEPPGNSLNHIDNSVRPGCYGINTATIGSPSNTEAGVCYWSRRAIDRETQFVVFENSDGGMYYRSRNQTNSGNWSGWRKIAADVVYATTEQAGLVELATNTEAAAGTDTTRAVTPAGAKALLSDVGVGAGAIDITSLLGAKGSGFYKGTWTSPPGYTTVAINVADGQGSDGRTAGGFQLGFTAGSNPGLQWRQSLGAGSFGGLRTLWDNTNLQFATLPEAQSGIANKMVDGSTVRYMINDKIGSAVSVTVTGDVTSPNLKVMKVGTFVFFSFTFTRSSSSAAGGLVATIPAGMRPIGEVNMTNPGLGHLVKVAPSGGVNVSFYGVATGEYYFTGIWSTT